MVLIVDRTTDLGSCMRYEVMTVDMLYRIGLVSVLNNERQKELRVAWYGRIYDAVMVTNDLLDAGAQRTR